MLAELAVKGGAVVELQLLGDGAQLLRGGMKPG